MQSNLNCCAAGDLPLLGRANAVDSGGERTQRTSLASTRGAGIPATRLPRIAASRAESAVWLLLAASALALLILGFTLAG